MASDKRSAAVAIAGITVMVMSLLVLATMQYALPDGFYSIMGIARRTVANFRENLPVPPLPRLSIPSFVLLFRLLIAAAWFGYAAAVIASFRGKAPKPKTVLAVLIPLSAILAVWWPSSLSADVYGYVAFARMHVYHDMNPYTHTPNALRAIGDPVARYALFQHPSIYGPLWTLISVVVVWLLKGAGLWWQVVALKLLSGLTLVLTAIAGRKVAERFVPGTGDLTMLAIGLNPLFLVEFPGNGHNDLFMVLPLLLGILYLMRRNHVLGGLMLGCSVGVKFVSVVIIPWLMWEYTHGRKIIERISLTIITGLLMLVPGVLCYIPFWQGMAVFRGVSYRWHWGTSWSAASKEATLTYWLTRGLPHIWVDRVAQFLTGSIPIAIVYLGLSLWLWRKRDNGNALVAWIVISGCLAILTMGEPFPWYLSWAWVLALVRWNRTHIVLSAAYFVIGLICTMAYTIPR